MIDLKKLNLEENLSRIVMVIVGLVCVGLSIYYSTQFYITEFHRPFYIAIALAGAIGIFNCFSLVAATFLLKYKNKLMAAIFIPIAIAAIGFDISTVVGAQSANYITQEAIKQSLAVVEQTKQENEERVNLQGELLKQIWDDLTAQRKNIEKELEDARSRLRSLNTEYDNYTAQYNAARASATEETQTDVENKRRAMNSANVDVRNAQATVNTYNTELTSLREQELAARQTYMDYINNQIDTSQQLQIEVEEKQEEAVQSIQATFSDWLASVLTFIPRKWIQFILVLIPALFIDLISPIAMNFGFTLALGKRKEDDLEELEEQIQENEEENNKLKQKELEEEQKIAKADELIKSLEQAKIDFEVQQKALQNKLEEEQKIFDESVQEKIDREVNKVYELMESKKEEKPKRKYTPRKKIETPVEQVVEPIVEKVEEPVKTVFTASLLPEEKIDLTNVLNQIAKTKKVIEEKLPDDSSKKEEQKIEPVKEIKPIIDEKPVETIKPEPIIEKEDKKDADVLNPDSEGLIHYKFGKTTENIMKKLIDFVNLCIKGVGEFNMHPDHAAQQLKLGNRAKTVFLDRLSAIRLGTKTLITKNKYGEYYANYSAKQIIDYVSSVKND
jgi:hypothetical protein